MLELKGFVQNYSWGKLGQSSLVARLSGEQINPETPYAELWMGIHPNGDAIVKDFNITLKEYIEMNPDDILGSAKCYWKRQKTLPFLLKVLSINKALSIQCHPDQAFAEILHRNFPLLYKDPNHKPELAIALTEFEALCAFRPTAEIKEFIINVPELEMVITADLLDSYKVTMDSQLMRKILFSLMTKSEEKLKETIERLLKRLRNSDEAIKERLKYKLVKKLSDEFPGDCGVFMVYFLNEIHLEPGESLYLPPGIPHAYLSGDCVECMACSDNVVRAGLTPKYKDIETLLDMLDYNSYNAAKMKFKKVPISPYAVRFQPPVPDFGVTQVTIPEKVCWMTPRHDTCQVFIVVSGEGAVMGPPLKTPEEIEWSKKQEEMKRNAPKPVLDLRSAEPPEIKYDAQSSTVDSDCVEPKSLILKPGSIVFLQAFKQYCLAASNGPLVLYFGYANYDTMIPDDTNRGKPYR